MATEKRLIDANGAMEYAQKVFSDPVLLYAIKTVLDNAPTVDAVEVVQSRWIKDSDGDEYCENCSRYMPVREVTGDPSESNYCPNCGARMDLED